MTRPLRVIQAKNLRYKYYSITVTDTCALVRIPCPVIGKQATVNSDDILTVKSLYSNIIELNGDIYKVIAEGVFDLSKSVHRYWWTPGSNIMFYCTPQSISNGIVEVCQKGGLTIGTKENSDEWGQRNGQTSLFQLWCRNSSDSLIETAKSITVDSDGKLFTNIDCSNADVVDPEVIHTVEGASKYLNIQCKLEAPETVKPNEMFDVKLTIHADKDQHLATDCSGIFFVEAVDGYCPHTRVEVINGVGKFKACALMLEDGETMRIKVGTKTYTGKDEVIVKVKA